ncbi:hypothetical protein D3C87_1107060 [compost metagenome]
MAIFSKTTKQMVVALINQGNPQLPFPINETDFEFSLPEVITDPGNGHNTKIRVMSKPNTNYVGNVVLTYRRLDVSRIFKNMTLTIQNWIANGGLGTGTLTTLRTLLPLYAEKYGFNFAPEEWTDVALNGYHGIRGDTFTITPVVTNLAYVGSVSGKWEIGERTLTSLLPVDQINGRLFPGGNDFSEGANHKYWITPDGFDTDYTAYKDDLESSSLATGYAGAVRLQCFVGDSYGDGGSPLRRRVEALLLAMKSRDGQNYTRTLNAVGADVVNGINNKNDLTGLLFRRYALPHADVPEANAEFFNRCVVLDTWESISIIGSPTSTPRAWAAGRIFLHYNV